MLSVLTDHRARRLRLDAQGLVARRPGSAADVGDVVRALVAVQAQESTAAGLAVRARCQGLVASDVDHARIRDRALVRTWCLRGTLHLVAAEDMGWLLALLGPGLVRAGRRRRAELGLDDDAAERGVRVLRDMLERGGPLTRAEIASGLAARGIPAAGQATIHLIALTALLGLACYGPDRDGEPTFVLLDGWLVPGPALPRPEALTELARRYLSAYGPATPRDLAVWSGLPMGDVRAGWQSVADRLIEVEVRGSPAWLLREQSSRLNGLLPDAPLVRLVPGYDPYLLGYENRELAVDAAHRRQIHPGGGVLHPALLIDGRAAATWKTTRRRGGVQVSVDPFQDEDLAVVQPQLQAELDDVARYLSPAAAAAQDRA